MPGAAVAAGAEATKEAERRPWLSSTRSRVAAIGGVVLLAAAGVLYLQWRPDYGSEEKTRDAINASAGNEAKPPRPLTLQEVEGANLLTILQRREVHLGRNAIALRLDRQQCARLGVCDASGKRHEFRLADSGALSKAVNDTLKDPEKSGFGFVIEQRDGTYVLRASAAGFVARISAEDIDDGIDGVLNDQCRQAACPADLLKNGGLKPSMLALPYRAQTPWSREQTEATEIITLQPVGPESAGAFAQRP